MSKTEGVECLCDEVNQQSIVVVVIVSEWRDAARQLMKLPSMEQEIQWDSMLILTTPKGSIPNLISIHVTLADRGEAARTLQARNAAGQ